MKNQVDENQNSSGEGAENLAAEADGQDCVAGRELDALVAVRVMGRQWDATRCEVCGWPLRADVPDRCHPNNCSYRPRPQPTAKDKSIARYSTDIAAAMQVVTAVQKEHGWRFSLLGHEKGYWHAEFFGHPASWRPVRGDSGSCDL